jgi:Flp pilus assembly protein TadG
MMQPIMNRSVSERGAVLVQAAIVLLVLIAFTTFVFDYGVLWVARNQAQTAADAGALAGAIALAYDDTTYPPTVHPDLVRNSAAYAALCASGSSSCTSTPSAADPVWPAQSGASSAVDVLFECPPGFSGNCVRVNVYRNGQSGNVIGGPSWMLPTFFGGLLGLKSPTAAGPLAAGQGVKATASARVAAANASNCLRPFAIPDYFWDMDGDGVFTPGIDIYTPPTSGGMGTGYAPGYDVGTVVSLFGDTKISSGHFRLLDLLGGRAGGDSQAGMVVEGCTPDVYAIGDTLPEQNGQNAAIGDNLQAVIDLDPSASWNPDLKKVVGSCVDTHTCSKYVWDSSGKNLVEVADPGATVSPRVLTLPLYDPQKEAQAVAAGTGDDLEIVNFIGFFLTTFNTTGSNKEVDGVIVTEAGANLLTSGSRTVSMDSAFLTTIQLIR